MKTTLKLFRPTDLFGNEGDFTPLTMEFNTLNEALECAEYHYHLYLWPSQVIDSNGDIYAEYEY